MANIKNYRRALLQGTGSVLLASLGATGAIAADATIVTVATTGAADTSTSNGQVVINSPLFKDAATTATASAITGSITSTGTATGTFSVLDNTTSALASANIAASTVGLDVISSDALLDGIAVSSASLNTGAVNAYALNQTIAANLTGFESGAVAVTGNRVSATTSINSTTQTIAGAAPIGYVSPAGGEGTATVDADATAAANVTNLAGTIVASTIQKSAGPDSGAYVGTDGSTFTAVNFNLALNGDINTAVTGSATLDSNTAAATFSANTATTTVGLGSADGSLAGTAVVGTAQVFDGNTATASAFNANTNVTASVTESTFDNSFNGSALSVASNRISASANGNTATDSIAVADATAYTGSGTGNDSSLSVFGGVDIAASGDLVIATSQQNTGTAAFFSGFTAGADVTAVVDKSVNSTIDVSLNQVLAASTANRLTSSVSNGTGSASFAAGVTLVGEQRNGDFLVIGSVQNTNIAATVGNTGNTGAGIVSGSDVALSGNVSAATATANTLRQTVALDATVLGLGGGVATASATTLATTAGVTASGAVTVGSVQVSANNAGTQANNVGSRVILTSNDGAATNSGNALLVSTNTQEAFATGSSAANGVTLAGNSVGSEVAVVSLQQNLDTSEVYASVQNRAALIIAGSLGGTASATAELTGNIVRAVSTGVTVANTLNVDAQTVAVTGSNRVASSSTYDGAATGGQAFDLNNAPSVTAGYALLNDQTVLGSVEAFATPISPEAAFLVSVGVDVNAGSSVDNNGNTHAAQAQGAVAANSSTLDIATLSTTGFAPVAAVSNVQTVGDLGVTATAFPRGGAAVVSTTVAGDVTDASVATSGNAVLATTDATKSVNRLAVNSTTLTAIEGAVTTPTAGVVSVSGGVNTADAAFSVANAQATGTSSVVASLVETGVTGARISTTIGDAISGSSVASSSNLLSALANANDTVNSLTLSANSLQTTAGVLSAQISEAAVVASTRPTFAGDFSRISVAVTGDISNSTIAVEGNVVQGSAIANVGTNTLAVSATSIAGDGATTRASAGLVGTASTADADYVLVNDQQSNGGSSTALVANTFAIDQSNAAAASITGSSLTISSNSQLGEAGNNFATNSVSISATDLDAAAAETSAALTSTQTGSATVQADSVVDVFTNIASSGSTIDMNSNVNTARGFFNSAANTLSVAGTNIASASAADANVTTGASNVSLADYALSNNQAATGPINTSANLRIYNSDGGDATTPGMASGSISLSSNINTATTTMNAGTNAVLVNSAASPGASVATVAAVGNNQSSTSASTSGSTTFVTIEAALNGNNTGPVAMIDNSTVALNGNATRATSTLNTATNSLAVYGANINDVGATNTNAVADSATNSVVTADFAVNNVQSASGAALSSSTYLSAVVGDANGDAAGGVAGSDISISGNLARAESNANAASNSVIVSGDAQLGATAGLGNDQTNGVATSATSTASVPALLKGLATQNALNGSSLTIEGNSSTAVARGNTATNAMTYAAGANYGTSNVGATVTDTASTATAAAVVLNAQNNTGNVTATGSGTYNADLTNNTGATGAGVLNSTVRVGGNTINAFAFGNSAVNSLVMTALNTGMPTAAVSSNQTNTAAIAATVSGNFIINGTGTVGSSSLAAIGNLVGAQAIGNSSTTIIIGR